MMGAAGVDKLIAEWQWAESHHRGLLAKARGRNDKRVQREELRKCQQILVVLQAVREG